MVLLLRIAVSLILLFGVTCRNTQETPADTIRLAVQYELISLDPHLLNKISSLAILSNFYEPLVRTEAKTNIKPCLATLWENKDPLTWVFHLRKDVRFTNGKEMDSGDVVYSFQRLLKSTGLELSGYVSNISSVSALDRYTVELRTERPISVLLNKVSFVLIVPENSDAESMNTKVVGTGPYKLAEWKKGQSIRMERNEGYWGEKPDLSQATYLLGRSAHEALDLLFGGNADFAQSNSKKIEGEVRQRKGLKSLRWDSLFVKILAFNFREGEIAHCSEKSNPFTNRKVREALHLAINRQALVDRLEAPSTPATQPVPPFTFGYNPGIPQAIPSMERAKVLLKEAGLESGFRVTLHSRKNFGDAAKEVQAQLLPLGIVVDLRILTDTEFFTEIRSGKFAFYVSQFGCTTGDASDILDYTLHTIQPELHFGGQNYGTYSNFELDRAIEESSEIQSPERRRERLQKIMTMLMEDLPWVPLYVNQDAYAFASRFSYQPRNDSIIRTADIHLVD